MSHFLTVILALFILLSSSKSVISQVLKDAKVPCNQVVNKLSPCLSYLDGQYASPSKPCCKGAKYVWGHYGKSKAKRQGVCACLVSLLPLLGVVMVHLFLLFLNVVG
ncbi:Non-specific lipid-transfer protein 3 [Bienertia sinuspersici]